MAKIQMSGFDELKKLRDSLEQLQDEKEDFCEAAVKELAARLLRNVVMNTPTGNYPASTGKKGGTLKRGWTVETHEEAMNGTKVSVAEWCDSAKVKHVGGGYEITVKNPVEYAQYVEYGHRKTGRGGWVSGKFMLTNAEAKLQMEAQAIVERKLKKWLRERMV